MLSWFIVSMMLHVSEVSVWMQGIDDAQGGRLSQIEQELYEMEVRAANVVSWLISRHIAVRSLWFNIFQMYFLVGLCEYMQ